MKIFISWSGERSQALAQALHQRLPYVLQYLDPWLSQSDIDAGERWAEQVAKELEACSFGITCLTAENVSSPWILFESGALAKSMQEGRVVPLLLDLNISDLSGPLAQFQAKKADRNGILDVIQALNKIAPNALAEGRVKPLFDALWPDFEKSISEIPKATGTAKRTRPQSEILEELVDSVRNLDGRYREIVDEGGPSYRRRRMRFNPMMMDEMMHRVGSGPRDPINILVLASFLREDFPWVYELAQEAYQAIKARRPAEAREASQRFMKAVEMLSRGPFLMDEFMDKRTHMMLREVTHMLDFASLEADDSVVNQAPKPKARPKRGAV